MNKPSLAVIVVGTAILAAPAFAQKPRTQAPAPKQAVKKAAAPAGTPAGIEELAKKPVTSEGFDIPVRTGGLGDAFDIGPRASALPAGDEPALAQRAHGLSDGQVNVVLAKHLAEVEYCWNKQPAARRHTDTTAVIRLTVEASGKVTTVDVAGEQLPSGLAKCISSAASRWTFPVAEIQSDVETAVSLRSI